MKTNAVLKIAFSSALILLFAVSGRLPSDLCAQSASASSRAMEQAIRLYNNGQDSDAMDRFMDILVKGSPSEKALANEYISKITLRMNSGVPTVKDRGAQPTALSEVAAPAVETQKAAPLGYPAAASGDEAQSQQGGDDAAQRERANARITERISVMRRDLLLALGRSRPVQIYMGSDGMPVAMTLDPSYFFSGDTSFRSGSENLLSMVSGLMFTLGKANIMILPDGATEGEMKIQSIRKALAIDSYFESRGISKARLNVNLTGSEVHYPSELTNISGIIILFDYDKHPRLEDSADMTTKGPRVSLGIYPTAISVYKNEGSIVEFSVFQSPVGTPTWKFQIFEIRGDGSRLLLQEVSGSGPMYNQSYWNGRQKFFGPSYPSGRYMFTVTAADPQGQKTSLSRWLLVRPTPQEEAAMRSVAARQPVQNESVAPTGLKSRSLAKGGKRGGSSGKLLKRVKTHKKYPPRKFRPAAVRKLKRASPARSGGDNPAAEKPGQLSGQVSYRIFFTDRNALTNASEKRLEQVAETMGYYPMASIQLTGFAYSGEADAAAVAQSRVNKVADRLAEKYKIDRSRMQLSSKVTEATKPMVEIRLAGG